jgi:hypothetical protein
MNTRVIGRKDLLETVPTAIIRYCSCKNRGFPDLIKYKTDPKGYPVVLFFQVQDLIVPVRRVN